MVSRAEPAKDPAAKFTSADHHALSKMWDALISAGVKHRSDFQKSYEQAVKFAYGNHEFVYEDVGDMPFKATVPKVWEMINIFGPMLNFRNPHRNVKVRFNGGKDERAMAFTQVMKDLLNYAANELRLVSEMRECVDESVVGCGVMWLQKDGNSGLWGHFHDSPMNLAIDPDAETLDSAWWVARKHSMPRWEFAGEIANVALDHEDLPNVGRSSVTELVTTEALKPDNDDETSRSGTTNDLLTVWEVWSRMGIGWRGKSIPEDFRRRVETDQLGDFVHFYIIPTSRRVWVPSEWPVPLWADNAWPCELLYYRKKRGYVWPVPLLEPSLPLQKSIDWIMTFILIHLRKNSRDFVAGPKALEDPIVEKILSGADFTYVPLNNVDLQEAGGDASKIIQFLQHPSMQPDLWRVMELALKMWEESSGLAAPLYAQSGGAESRTATADQNRQSRANLRPDDMREVVENFHTRMARKEAIAARLDYTPDFVAEMMGDEAGQIWGQYQERDMERVMREYDYRIEAGSAAKPNIDTERNNSMEMYDRVVQVGMQVNDLAAVNKATVNLQRGLGIPEEDHVTFNPPPPPPDPEEKKLEIEAAKAEQSMSIEQQKAQLKMQTEMQKAQLDAELKKAEAQLDLQLQREKGQGELEMQGMEMEAAAIGHEQKIRQSEEMHRAKVAIAKKPKPRSSGR